MPYFLKKVNNGFKVCDENKCFSKNPLKKSNAIKQRIAIILNEKSKIPKKYLFL